MTKNRSPEAVARPYLNKMWHEDIIALRHNAGVLADLIRAERAVFRRIVRTELRCEYVLLCVRGSDLPRCTTCTRRDRILAALDAKPTKPKPTTAVSYCCPGCGTDNPDSHGGWCRGDIVKPTKEPRRGR